MAKNHNQSTNGNFPSSDTQLDATPCHPKGMLVVIGGHEQKEGHRPILEVLAKRVGSGKLVVATLASEEPESQWKEYERSFRELGVLFIFPDTHILPARITGPEQRYLIRRPDN